MSTAKIDLLAARLYNLETRKRLANSAAGGYRNEEVCRGLDDDIAQVEAEIEQLTKETKL